MLGTLTRHLDEKVYRQNAAIARSDLDKIMVSPAHFKAELGKVSEQTEAMRFGTLVHGALLEKDAFWPRYMIFDGRRAGAKWEAFQKLAERSQKEILTTTEERKILGIADSVKAAGVDLTGLVEASIFWRHERTGVDLKARLDLIRDDVVYDLKTTSDLDGFAASIEAYGYHRQAAWYLAAAAAAGIWPKSYVLIVVEKKEPYRVELIEMPTSLLGQGFTENEANLTLYKFCLDKNNWPEYEPEKKEPFMSEPTLSVVEPAADPFRVIRGRQPAAWKVAIYGQPGIGKSSLGAFAPSPLFMDLENGLARVDCVRTPTQLKTFDEVKAWLRHVVKSTEYKTAVIDTLDALEKMLCDKVIEAWNRSNKKVTTVADIPYGRGGDLLVAEWKEVIDIFDHVTAAGKNVLLIGHEQIVKFENPTDANYDFYTVNIHKKAAPVVVAKLDAVLFARLETVVKGEEKGKAISTGRRVLHTQQAASYVSKNRFDLPAEVSMERGSEKSLFDLFV